MKLKNIIIFIVGVVMLFSFWGCTNGKDEDVKSDALRFKEEYEALNEKKNESNGKKYRNLEIEEDNPFIYKEAEDILRMMDDGETFVVYFGFASCPWCRSVIKPLIEVSNDLNISTIYYVDIKDIRDTIVRNDDGEFETTKNGTDGYYGLLEKMEDVLDDYTLPASDDVQYRTGKKRIYAPNIVAVVSGKATFMTDGISDEQTDAYMKLTEDMEAKSYNEIKCAIECVVDSEDEEMCSAKKQC